MTIVLSDKTAEKMEKALMHFIILGVISGLTKGAGVLPDGPLNAAVGETVMFTTTLTPSEIPFVVLHWSFGDRNIISSNAVNTTAPEYEGRITLFVNTGSLELRNVALNDSGEYSFTIMFFGGGEMQGDIRLNVYESVSNVTAMAYQTDLVEFISSVRLSCSSSGSNLTFLWLNGNTEVTESDRVQLTDGNSTLTILNVTRYDQGPFTCRVSNPVSNDISDPINLTISFGPENVHLKQSPAQEYYEEGSDIILTCSAVSRPPALIQWFLNGYRLYVTEPELRLMNIQMDQSGTYQCYAYNQRTGGYEASQPSDVSVLNSQDFTCTLSSCSGGCIAGAVIASLVVLGAAVGGACYIYEKKCGPKNMCQSESRNANSAPPPMGNKEQKESEYENDSEIYENSSVVYENS